MKRIWKHCSTAFRSRSKQSSLPSSPTPLEELLDQPKLYLEEIETLHEKLSAGNLLFEVNQAGVPFATMSMERHSFAKVLAKTVSSGQYEFQPVTRSCVTIEGKRRDLYFFCPSDRVVHGVIARLLTDEVTPHLPPGVHSYQRGKSWWNGVAALSEYQRTHVQQRPLRQRGVYVLRRDIRQYTDSIPVHDQAPLWKLLFKVLAQNRGCNELPSQLVHLMHSLIRPIILDEQGYPTQNTRGIPTGSPITSALYNLCAVPLDHALGQVPGAMYARYSDDFVFVHPDPDIVKCAHEQIQTILANLGLEANAGKGQTLYVTGAGRHSEIWPEAQAATAFSFLGCRVAMNGEIFLKRKRARKVLRDLRRRAQRTAEVINVPSTDVRGKLICSALNEALSASSLFQQKSSRILRQVVTDRTQLRHFDKLIELIVAETISGIRGPRAFREVPPKRIRDAWKLMSLFHERNISA